MAGPVEHEQERVAAPLEQPGAPVVGLVEQRGEHAVERVAHQLRADLALARQPLGQRGEAGDVDEHERRLDLAVARVGRVRSQSMTSRGTYGRRNSDSSCIATGEPGTADIVIG